MFAGCGCTDCAGRGRRLCIASCYKRYRCRQGGFSVCHAPSQSQPYSHFSPGWPHHVGRYRVSAGCACSHSPPHRSPFDKDPRKHSYHHYLCSLRDRILRALRAGQARPAGTSSRPPGEGRGEFGRVAQIGARRAHDAPQADDLQSDLQHRAHIHPVRSWCCSFQCPLRAHLSYLRSARYTVPSSSRMGGRGGSSRLRSTIVGFSFVHILQLCSPYFAADVLDGAMITLAMFTLNALHPGYLLKCERETGL